MKNNAIWKKIFPKEYLLYLWKQAWDTQSPPANGAPGTKTFQDKDNRGALLSGAEANWVNVRAHKQSWSADEEETG